MDFFKSVFADDPSDSDEHRDGDPNDDAPTPEDSNPNNPWSFGDLIKTLASKSETVIETYRRDLEEFGSGLRKETAVIRDVASRAVKDLPASLEAGASVAQESLESVGQAIDDIGASVWKSTAEIVAHGKDSILAVDDDDDDYNDRNSDGVGLDSKPYNRFESQLRAIQSSASTYLDEPEDLGNYEQWKLGFVLEDKSEEIKVLVKENGEIGEIYENFVPEKVDQESFWFRYFYKVHKLKEVEDARVKLVKRAISGEEEELSWDFDDEDEEDENQSQTEIKEIDDDEKKKNVTSVVVGESSPVGPSENVGKSEPSNLDEKVVFEGKINPSSDSGKESDVSIVSRPEEEDLGWDEIEDVGSSGDEIKAEDSSSSRADPIKRLSNAAAADEDEDLSWDIEEDDDEPKKS